MHLIVDNYATHKHARVNGWLAKRPQYHVHSTPTYATWINQVERWFGIITGRAIRRGSFTSVKELVSRIKSFVETPFVWTTTAHSILAKVERLCSYIPGHDNRSGRHAGIACPTQYLIGNDPEITSTDQPFRIEFLQLVDLAFGEHTEHRGEGSGAGAKLRNRYPP